MTVRIDIFKAIGEIANTFQRSAVWWCHLVNVIVMPVRSRQQHNTKHYTGMDKTGLNTSSGSLFVRDSGCSRHVERNCVQFFGVQTAWHNRMSTYVIT